MVLLSNTKCMYQSKLLHANRKFKVTIIECKTRIYFFFQFYLSTTKNEYLLTGFDDGKRDID